jgi:hypothetical protein
MTIKERIERLRGAARTSREMAERALDPSKKIMTPTQYWLDEALGCDLAADFLERVAEDQEDS